MQGEPNNYKPFKQWEQTPTGYYIVPAAKLDIKTRTDQDGELPDIVRCTCPDCASEKHHGDSPCVRLNRLTGIGRCYKCGFLFITDQKVAAYNRKRGVQKRQWKLPDTSRLRPLDGIAIDYLLHRGIQPETARAVGVCSATRSLFDVQTHLPASRSCFVKP